MNERQLTAFLHARSATVVMALLAIISCIYAWQRGAVVPMTADMGVGFLSANLWTSSKFASALMGVGLTILSAILLVWINSIYNVLRSITSLVATMFIMMQIGVPSLMGQFYGGTLMNLLMMVCVFLLFSTFGNPDDSRRRIFLIFFLFALGAFTERGYLFYLPVLLLGTIQMRVFSMRTFLAAALGALTPVWLLMGLGIVTPWNLRCPSGAISFSQIVSNPELAQSAAVVAFTIVIGFAFTLMNLMKILSYNSRVRAFNAFLTLLYIFSAIYALLDFNNFAFYVPLLNCATAYQIGHFFTYRRHRRTYLPILLLMACYAGFYIWAVTA